MSKQIDDNILMLYEPKKLLGSGAYGYVWRVLERSTRQQYALKKIFDAFQNSVDSQRTYRQITVLHELNHPNIIKLKRVLKSKNKNDLYLVFQYMQADLHSLVGQSVLTSQHIKFILYQLLKALKYLHSAQLIHRDLKPSNVLINSDCEVKICDFGLVRSLTYEQSKQIILSQEVATRWYRSPEMLLSSHSYDKSTDVWSLGCIFAQLLFGKPLFPGNSTFDQIERIVQFTGMPSKESIDSLNSELAQSLINQLSVQKTLKSTFHGLEKHQIFQIIKRMLQFNPKKRISIDQALQSEILRQFNKNQEFILCNKCLFFAIDDNDRLSIRSYRQIIYEDIERRYPQNHLVLYQRIKRGHKSVTKKSEPKIQNISSMSLVAKDRKVEQNNNKFTRSNAIKISNIRYKKTNNKIKVPIKISEENVKQFQQKTKSLKSLTKIGRKKKYKFIN